MWRKEEHHRVIYLEVVRALGRDEWGYATEEGEGKVNVLDKDMGRAVKVLRWNSLHFRRKRLRWTWVIG